jgi:hypothetical protein
MKKLMNGTLFLVFLSVAMPFSAVVLAKGPAQRPLPVRGTTDVQVANRKGSKARMAQHDYVSA